MFLKFNETLCGSSKIPTMVMLGSHSYISHLQSDISHGDHVALSSSAHNGISLRSGEDACDMRKYNECLREEKTYIEVIYGNRKSPKSDMLDDQEGDQYSSCIILKGFSWLEIKRVQMSNDMKNESFLKFTISQHNQTSFNFSSRINVYASLPPLSFIVQSEAGEINSASKDRCFK